MDYNNISQKKKSHASDTSSEYHDLSKKSMDLWIFLMYSKAEPLDEKGGKV